MAETSNFALRMPPEIKDAAKALTKVLFHEPSEKGADFVNSIFLHSINDALVYLMRKGLRETLAHIDKELQEYTDKVAISQELMAFFMANPVASEVRAANLPESSPARVSMEKEQAFYDDQPASEYESNERYDVLTRRQVSQEYADGQRMMYSLNEAKGFIQRALIAKTH